MPPPPKTIDTLALELPLACAKRLRHLEHDAEFREFMTAEIERAKAVYTQIKERTINSRRDEQPPGAINSRVTEILQRQKEYRDQWHLEFIMKPVNERVAFLKELEE